MDRLRRRLPTPRCRRADARSVVRATPAVSPGRRGESRSSDAGRTVRAIHAVSPERYSRMSPTMDIPRRPGPRHHRHMVGQVKFYDAAMEWGVIQGADGGLYAVRGAQLP